MKLILLAALIATSIAFDCLSTEVKTEQRCFNGGVSKCATHSEPGVCSACHPGYEVKNNGATCSSLDSKLPYTLFSSYAQAGATDTCVTFSAGMDNYTTLAGCVSGGVNYCNSCSVTLSGSDFKGVMVKNGKCSVTCSAGCKECSDASTCTECFTGYKKESNACTKCPANCNKCETDTTKCDTGSCASKFMRNASETCDGCPTGCLKCDADKTKCETCDTPTYWKNGDVCAACSDTTGVAECSGDPATKANQTKCSGNYYLVSSTDGCVESTNNCKKIKANGKCETCWTGYYIDSGVCKLPGTILTNCATASDGDDSTGATCLTCKSDSYKTEASGKITTCTPCGNNCKSCESASKKCTACDDDTDSDKYYPDNTDSNSATLCTAAGAGVKTVDLTQTDGTATACREGEGYAPFDSSTNKKCTL